MPDIRAVLLVPEEGDPYGLLREGPCGARPPIAVDFGSPVGWLGGIHKPGGFLRVLRRALVLAWDGEVVPEGMDRMVRALGWPAFAQCGSPEIMWWTWRPFIDHLGTIVLLDADGREVTDA